MPKVNFIMGQNFKCLKADIISLEIEIEYIWEKIWINIKAKERCKNRKLSSIFKILIFSCKSDTRMANESDGFSDVTDLILYLISDIWDLWSLIYEISEKYLKKFYILPSKPPLVTQTFPNIPKRNLHCNIYDI